MVRSWFIPAWLICFGLAASPSRAVAEPPTSATAENLQLWIRALDDASYAEREAAGKRLRSAGNRAIAPLVEAAAKDKSLEVTVRAVRILAELSESGDPETAAAVKAALVELARSSNKAAALRARQALRAHQERIVTILSQSGAVVHVEGDVVRGVSFDQARRLGDNLRLLYELPDLEYLSFSTQLFDDGAMAELRGLPNLRELNLFQSRIGDAGLKHLQTLPELRRVPMGLTLVTDAGLAHLKDLTQLEYVGLRGNRITDAGLPHLKNLKNLTGLHLGETQVTDAGLPHLYGLKNLQTLSFWETKATAEGIAELAKQLPQTQIRTSSQ